MVLNRIINWITKISEFKVKNLTAVFKWKMPFFYGQEGVNERVATGCEIGHWARPGASGSLLIQ